MTGPIQTHSRTRFLRTVFRGLTPAVLAVLLAGAAAAQDDQEPPALVGRISAIQGGASIQRSDAQDWVDAGINEPVTIGDAVYAPDGSDVRLQIGATDLDLKSDSEIDIAQLDETAGAIRLDSGTLDLRVAALPTADGLSVATPRGTVKLTQPGIYRIDAGDENDPTRVTAFTGSAGMGDSAAAVTVQHGQVLIISGTPDAPQYAYSSDVGDYPSDWRTPPRVVQVRETERYVAPEMTGAEDLYQYGAFEQAADYGTVWYPRDVPANWQPYRFGHWEYVRPWGQTWIDDRPWGFAPFHYGRWAYIGHRWGWVPGQYTPHPVYAPALVAFVGGGGLNVSISIGGRGGPGGGFGGGGAIGWVPLAPGEGYHPPYRASQTYIQNINKTVIVNKTVINNTTVINNNGPRGFGPNAQPQTMAGFANRRFATVVPAEAVAARRPVAQAAVQVKPEQLEKAQVDAEAVRAIKPVPAAARPAARPGPVARPANPRQAANVRPALPPARNRPGAQNRPAQPTAAQPATPQPAAGQPAAGQPAAGQPGRQPAANPAPGKPAAAPQPPRPDNRPAPIAKPAPEAKPGPETRPSPEAKPAPEARPGAKPAPEAKPAPMPPRGKPALAKPAEATKPETTRPPAKERPATDRPAPRPADAKPAPAPQQPQQKPQAAARPQRPEARPQPAAPKQEARPAPAPRPEPRQQPQAAPRPQPQAQPPRPQPQQQRPQPQPQAQQHPGKDKKPDDTK